MKSSKLITEVVVKPSGWKINHHAHVLTLGSCFAEVLGQQLKDYKYPVLNNPFGTVFNPLTITKILDMALEGKSPDPALYITNTDGIQLHHDFHSSQWGVEHKVFDAELTAKLGKLKGFLRSANVLVITLGTAYAYRHRALNAVVGNCHKIPADKFVKELLHQDQILMSFEQILFKLQTFNRNLKIILTVSPVRHTKDTLILNQVSKSILRIVCHRLSEKFKQVEYFPSYEIMVDELRDYRYFEEDLIHPNKIAEDYIFNTFVNSFVDTPSQDFMKEWLSVRQALNHKPQHGFTISHLHLLQSLHEKLSEMDGRADVTQELEEVKRRIAEFPDF